MNLKLPTGRGRTILLVALSLCISAPALFSGFFNKGSIWYVSNHSGQMSYEDEALGGVFTHFFIEALKHSPKEGPGIPL